MKEKIDVSTTLLTKHRSYLNLISFSANASFCSKIWSRIPRFLFVIDKKEKRKPWGYNCCCSTALSHVWLFVTHQASLSFTVSEFVQTHVHWVSDAIQPSHPLSPSSPPALNLPQHWGLFSSESALCIRWPKYWRFSFSISPSNECSVFISFRTDWFDLLAIQGTLKNLLQHHNSKATILKPLWLIFHIHTWLLEKS